MPIKNFLYYLTEEDGRSITVQNGLIVALGAHTPLVNTPGGWEDLGIGYERVMKYHGLQRVFSLPLQFYLDSAFILRNEFYTKNIERKIFLIIQQLTLEYGPSDYRWLYKYLYKGLLDLSTFKSDIDRVSVSISEGGLQKQFKAKETTVFAIPFDADAKYLYMDGVELGGSYKWLVPAFESLSTGYLGMYLLQNDNPIPGLAVFTVMTNFITGVPDQETLHYFAEVTQDMAEVSLTGEIKGLNSLGSDGPLSVTLYVFNTITNTIRITTDLAPDDPYPENYTLAINETLDLLQGDRLFLKTGSHFSGESEIQFTAKSKQVASTVPFYLPYDMGRKLVGEVTGNPNNFESTALQSTYKDYGITCGDGIRNIAGAEIKTTIANFFEDYDVTCFLGLSIDNGKIRIEDRATFYDPTNPIDLGEVRKHEINYAKDLVGSTIKIGHIKPDIEDVNGKFDPNGSAEFTTPIESEAKKLELVGPYKKGPYEIELTRINLQGKTTTDSDNDNHVFVIHVKEVAPVVATVSFVAASQTLIFPNGVVILPGMRIVITGTANGNDKAYIIEDVASIIVAQVASLDQAVTDEATVSVTIEFPYILNRDAVVDPAPEVCPAPDTIFNVVFTPKNILKKHGRWWRSIFWGFDTEYLKWQSSDKNKEFKSTVNGVVIDEDTDESIAAFGERLFFPLYHDFESLSPIELIDLLEANPNRCFQFTDADTGAVYTGFNIKSGLAVNTEAPQQYKLLSSPLNDVTTLIY